MSLHRVALRLYNPCGFAEKMKKMESRCKKIRIKTEGKMLMRIEDIHYVPSEEFAAGEKLNNLFRYLQLSAEVGCPEQGRALIESVVSMLDAQADRFQKLVLAQEDSNEPFALDAIRALRPSGPRRILRRLPEDYLSRLKGAFNARMAGCTLGAALEFQPVETMRSWAAHFGDDYPLKDYWSQTMRDPDGAHYIVGKNVDLTRDHMDAVPPDDDTAYTVLGLLLLEQYGMNFTQEQLAEVWKRFLPLGADDDYGLRGCFWGERIMLKNLLDGAALSQAGLLRNPHLQNVAGWTRIDAYAYACPGWPEKAAELAYRDVSLNHRRNGIYGAMFMAAAISAAFAVDDPIEAVRIGLTEIPSNCLLANEIRWILAQKFSTWEEAYALIWKRLDGMFNGSATSTAVQVVAGLMLGNRDVTRTLGETVALGGDNDCTGATAGSILGATVGIERVPENWTRPFQGRMHLYLSETPEYLRIDDVCDRIAAVAAKCMAEG